MKIKDEVNISPCNPMGFGSVYCLCTILLPVTLNCFKINNKIISDDENSWCFLPKLEVFRQIIFWFVAIIFSFVTLIFQNQYKHEGDLIGKDSHEWTQKYTDQIGWLITNLIYESNNAYTFLKWKSISANAF